MSRIKPQFAAVLIDIGPIPPFIRTETRQC